MRTFWEKLTLAHAECNRPDFKHADRKSRHWYDLAVLADHDIGRSAIREPDLLADVIRVKNRFFKAAIARYKLCLHGGSNLLPNDAGMAMLQADYAQMLDDPLSFDALVERIRALQDEVNAAAQT